METGNNSQPSPWKYSQDDELAAYRQNSDISPVNWSASEYIDNEKNKAWFMQLSGVTAVAVVIIFLLTKDIVTAVVIIIAAILFGVAAKRKPRTLDYQIDHQGVIIDGKIYSYGLFKSFAVLSEGAFNSILLTPLKRFMPPISLYFPPENEEQIITTLGTYLPHEERNHDPIDRLMRKVRF